MTNPPLSPKQRTLAQAPLTAKIFLEGPAGAGKTTAGVARLAHLLSAGVPADEVLVIVPQRTLALPYYDVIHDPSLSPGGNVEVATIGGLARRMVELFWPLVAGEAGFATPDLPPIFLNIETAQYHMARIVRPLLEGELFFEGVAIDRNRLYSQLLDNLNKAAFVGFAHTEIGRRLDAAWIDPTQPRRIYTDVQECVSRFRAHCLANNLLDFSLVLEIFVQRLWDLPLCYGHLASRYRHLICDNLEEDTPVTHDLLVDWLPDFASAFLIFDQEAGFRRFLGADPESAMRLRAFCTTQERLSESFVSSAPVEGVRGSVAVALGRPEAAGRMYSGAGLAYEPRRFYPEMLDWVSGRIEGLVREEGVPPGEIVVLAPFLSDALRFSLMHNLDAAGIPAQSHRPSRSLREEPAVQSLLTLAALANPDWGMRPAPFDVAYALREGIGGIDLVRAQLLAEVLYRRVDGAPGLLPFERVKPEMQARITYVFGERYETLRSWLDAYRADAPDAPDIFFSRAFGELLSQPGFGFHGSHDAGKAAANLVDSAREFRWVIGPLLQAASEPVGQAFMQMVREGVIASQFVRSWELQAADAVLIAPAYTFLMNNRPVDYQFWLNAGSQGWGERLYQPLTNPHVLSRHWPVGRIWDDEAEQRANAEAMFGLVNGLLRRCRRGVFLGLSEMDEHGYEQKGPLLNVLQAVLRMAAAP